MQNYIVKKTRKSIFYFFFRSKTNQEPFSTFISTKRTNVIIC